MDISFVSDPQLKPDDNQHYDTFDNLQNITEKNRTSTNNARAVNVAEDLQGIRNAELEEQNVRATVNCYDCGKHRCIYSQRKLSIRDLRALNRVMERYDYTCGSIITGEVLQGVVSFSLQMDCSTPVEFPYYACNNSGAVRKEICWHCGEGGSVSDPVLLDRYGTVMPVCNACKLTKDIPKRNHIK